MIIIDWIVNAVFYDLKTNIYLLFKIDNKLSIYFCIGIFLIILILFRNYEADII